MIVSIYYNSSGLNCNEFGGCHLINETKDETIVDAVNSDKKIANITLSFTKEGCYTLNCSLANEIASTIQIQVTRK